jgi:cell division protein FtsQ
MWDDARQMNALAATLATITAIGLAWTAVIWLVRQPTFAFHDVVVANSLERTNPSHLEAVIREELTGTFFTMDLDRAKVALAQVPWVRGVALRRLWPDRLEVTVDEHAPVARWGDNALVNTRGEVFNATWGNELPLFDGPEGRSIDMLSRYQLWSEELRPLALTVQEIKLSARGGWQLKATGAQGPLTVLLGREEPDARLSRFVGVHARTLGALGRAGTRVDAVDLRYRSGFAARIPAFREKGAKPA